MRGSLKIFSWFRIPVYLHWSFILILLLPLWIAFEQGSFNAVDFFSALGLTAALFACVLLHEFGHSLMARHYKVETQDIILTPIGGIARLERMPENPKQELMVAIAGPMVNVIIVGILLILSRYIFFSGEVSWWVFKSTLTSALSASEEGIDPNLMVEAEDRISAWGMLIPQLVLVNVMMVLFNMIPAFPMDGGRVLRALLTMGIGRVRATRFAALTGQAIALLFFVLGIYGNAFTVALIGVFVFFTARSENAMVQSEHLLGKFTAADVVREQFTQLLENDWMQTPSHLLKHGLERHFLVFDLSDRLVGTLTEDAVLQAERKNELSATVSSYMHHPAEAVYDTDPLKYVFFLLKNKGSGIVAIVNSEQQVRGVIDQAGLDYFLRNAR